jgi:hypothetical protein
VILNILIILNLIYMFFNFISWHLIFYFFLWNLILIFLFLFILLLILFYWILFFNLIPNHLILIPFFVEFYPHSYDCKSFYFEFSPWLIFFLFCNFIPRCLISLKFFIIFDVYFFYHAFKTRPGSRPPSCPRSRVGSNDRGYRGQSDFLLCRK